VGLWQRLALIIVMLLLAAAGAGLLLWALYQYLGGALSPPSTAFVTGLAALLAAGGVAWLVRRITR